MLQMGQKDQKRRALLVGAPEIAPGVVDQPLAPAYEPQALEGEVLDRLKMDPEVRVFRNKLLMGLASMIVMIIAVVVMHVKPTSRPPPASRLPQASEITVMGTAKAEETGELVLGGAAAAAPTISRSDIAQIAARRFLAARSAEDWLEVVSRPQQWESAIRSQVLSKPLNPLPVLSMTVSGATTSDSASTVVRAELLGGHLAELHLFWQGNQAFIDWPSAVGWSALEWSDLMRQTPHQAVTLRVFAERANVFEDDFRDSGSLICVKLINPLRSDSPPLYAYAPKDSDEGQGIDFLLRDNEGPVARMIISVRYPVSPMRRDQLWIDKVIALGWFLPSSSEVSEVSSQSL